MDKLKFVYTSEMESVVHCRDCKYAHMTYMGECKYCDFWQEDGGEALYLDGDFYCAAGERRCVRMAEFREVMRKWERLCKSYARCIDCPMNGMECINPKSNEWNMNIGKAEGIIIAWATEHPEPKYPTWREVIEDTTGIMMIDVVDDPIPADIADKLGVKPKEA